MKNSDYDVDDIFADKASSSKALQKEQEKNVRKALDEEKSFKKTLDSCNWCFDGGKLEKNLVISIGEKVSQMISIIFFEL